jgi:hypothetical protein
MEGSYQQFDIIFEQAEIVGRLLHAAAEPGRTRVLATALLQENCSVGLNGY